MCTQPLILDSTLRSPEAVEFGEALHAKIVRQEEAVQAMVDLYQVFCAGLNPRRLLRCASFRTPWAPGIKDSLQGAPAGSSQHRRPGTDQPSLARLPLA